MGMVPGGTRANRKNYEPFVEWSGGRIRNRPGPDERRADLGRPADLRARRRKKDRLVAALQQENILAAYIGDVLETCGSRHKADLRGAIDMDAALFVFLALVGTSVGFLSGLLGIGGGIVMFPLLLYAPPLLGLGAIDVKSITGLTMVQGFFSALSGDAVLPQERAREQVACPDARPLAVPVVAHRVRCCRNRSPTDRCSWYSGPWR